MPFALSALDVTLAAHADGLRACTAVQTDPTWAIPNLPTTNPTPLTIMYPRPIAERGTYPQRALNSRMMIGLRNFLHTEWDKWISGEVWFPEIGVIGGTFPYKVELGAGAPSGTLYAGTIDEDEGHSGDVCYLRLYNASIAAGTYNFNVYITDSELRRTSVAVSLVVHAANAGDILDNFRICDFGAGTNGTGTQASPHNTFIGANVDGNPTLWGTDYTVAMAPTAIVILKGTKVITDLSTGFSNAPSAQNFALGGGAYTTNSISTLTRPRQIIGAWGSDITFDLTSAARSMNVGTADTWDAQLKNLTISGQRADPLVTPNTQMPQTSFAGRTRLHSVTFADADIRDPSSANIGCFATDGQDDVHQKKYSTLIDITFDNVFATSPQGVNSNCIVMFNPSYVLVDVVSFVNCSDGGAKRFNHGVRMKHGSYDCEFRRFTSLGGVNIAGTQIVGGGDGGAPNQQVRLMSRWHNIDQGTGACVQYASGQLTGDPYSVSLHFCTLVGDINVQRVDGNLLGDSTLYAFGNIIENTYAAPGFNNGAGGAVNADWTLTVDYQLNGAVGALVDNNGVPLSPANAAYGHTLPKAA